MTSDQSFGRGGFAGWQFPRDGVNYLNLNLKCVYLTTKTNTSMKQGDK